MKDNPFLDPGFADRLITTLSKAGMYPRDLAELAGISQEAAESAIRGVFPSAPELYRIAKALRVSMEWLVSGEEREICGHDSEKSE